MAVKTTMENTGDVRKFLANLATGVVHGDIDSPKAQTAINACKEIHASLYSEIKTAVIQRDLGREAATLGELPLGTA